MMNLEEKLEQAMWIAHSLFERGKASGSTSNLSFLHENKLYVTAGGSCFGTLNKDNFAEMDLDGQPLPGPKPSKEWPLHLQVYLAKPGTEAVIHTHSLYSVLWSCLPHEDRQDCIPSYTPYLKMKLGTIGLVPYAPPGSQELFTLFAQAAPISDGWLLRNHGPVAPGKSLMDAFHALEELEESARVAWELRHTPEALKI